jgi:NADP-dependent 3-hydroxy acid dehydrogenase YdfG
MRFEDAVALVTGASGGIGSSIASRLAAEGARVRMAGRSAATLETVASRTGGRASWDLADLSLDRDILALSARIERECGRLDILVHSAGLFSRGPVSQASAEEFDNQYRINLRAPFVVTQALLPLLRRSRGQIVFINSTAGQTAQPGVSQYAATKHGLKAFADSLRDEVNPDGVRVLSVFLGRTATPMQQAIHQLEGKRYRSEDLIQPDDVATAILAMLELPRTVEVTNIAMRPFKRPQALTETGVPATNPMPQVKANP